MDVVKEFYARMTVIHLKKKDVVKTSVQGVAIEFDHWKLASIRGIPGNNGICEYIKDVWEESKYTKPLKITRKFANDETLTAARRVKSDHELPYGYWLTMVFESSSSSRRQKGEEPKRYDYFEETFLTMCKLTRENGVWWIGSGENRRRDDAPEEEGPAENVHEEEEDGQTDFNWEAVVDEAAVEGELGSGDEKFYDAEDEVQESSEENEEVPVVVAQALAQ
ncbi:hypothetical protein Dimus_015625 [Dionaea muscipula]